jgi:hypothetical protein
LGRRVRACACPARRVCVRPCPAARVWAWFRWAGRAVDALGGVWMED